MSKAKCLHCRKAFAKGMPRQRYCSSECQLQAKAERQAAKRKAERTVARKPRKCDYCGERFTPTRNDARFCCDSHRAMAYREERNR